MSPRRECRGRPAFCRGLGCPQKPLFFSLAAYGGKQKERKRVFRGHPEPRQGGPCTPSRHPPVKEALPITNHPVGMGQGLWAWFSVTLIIIVRIGDRVVFWIERRESSECYESARI